MIAVVPSSMPRRQLSFTLRKLTVIAMLFLNDMELSVDLGKIIPNITFICMGINHLVVGLAFRKFEEE